MQAATKRAKAKSVRAKKPAKKGRPDLKKVYEALCAILKPYEKKLKWKEYGKNFYYLETHDPVYPRQADVLRRRPSWARTT